MNSTMTESVESINTLRVAQSELSSGNTSGRVFLRLSDGAAAFAVDRSVAQDHVGADLRRALLNKSSLPQKKSSSSFKKATT